MKIVALLVLLPATVQLLGVGAFTVISVCRHEGHTNNINNSKRRGTTEVGASDGEIDIASSNNNNSRRQWLRQQGGAVALSLSSFLLASSPQSANAAGKAKKGVDVSSQDLSGQDLSNKDFRSAMAKATNFSGAKLQGAQFQDANLVGASFVGADLRGANFDGAVLDQTTFKDANANGSKFGPTILDAGNLEGIDLTSSIWPSKYRIMICEMDELKGENPTTGVATRRSAFCDGAED